MTTNAQESMARVAVSDEASFGAGRKAACRIINREGLLKNPNDSQWLIIGLVPAMRADSEAGSRDGVDYV